MSPGPTVRATVRLGAFVSNVAQRCGVHANLSFTRRPREEGRSPPCLRHWRPSVSARQTETWMMMRNPIDLFDGVLAEQAAPEPRTSR